MTIEMSMASPEDLHFMAMACQLAVQGRGLVEPNPMVGCVLVRDGNVLATGFHERFGGPHAERVALANLGPISPEGATAYVTLEPCCHFGKTPPCTDALIAAGIRRVCCAMLDPFPQVSGKGAAQLRAAGIEVDVLAPHDSIAHELLAPYLKRVLLGLPYVIAKWAMSLDGKMATRTGDSRWISGPQSRAHAHHTRGRVDAIIVGSRTARLDDPLLTARPPGPRTPVRVVVDSAASVPLDSQLVASARQFPTLLWCGPEAPREKVHQLTERGCNVQAATSDEESRLVQLLRYLVTEYHATNVVCEGGGTLLGQFADQSLIDELHVYIAPKIIGGHAATAPCLGLGITSVADGPHLRIVERAVLGEDQFLRARMMLHVGIDVDALRR